MFSVKMTLSTAAVCLIVLLSVVGESQSRNMDSSALEELSSGTLVQGAKVKRFYDSSCKGIYDREIFNQLERVCEECYNLYRKPQVAKECRRNCYTSDVFDSCLRDLMMHDLINEYKEMAFMVAGKK